MNKSSFETGIEFARQLDRQDPLREFRQSFYMPEPDTIYLDGNSLGRLPLRSQEQIRQVVDHQWGTRLIRSWNEGWYDLPEKLGNKLAPIIGAGEGEVIVCDSTSLNLFKLTFAAMKSQQGRTRIVSDALNFPTDLYILQGIIDQLGPGYELVLVPPEEGIKTGTGSLEKAIDENTAVVVLSHVAFRSAFMYDMDSVTRLAHQKGALMLWDLSHSAGAVPVELNRCNADLAVGCTYKYLNGGPGSPAYLFVKRELQENMTSPVWGWFGDRNPFSFKLKYEPAKGIRKFLVGTPPVLSMQAICAGLDMMMDAGMDRIRRKSMMQTEYLIFLFDQQLNSLGFSLGSPREPEERGSHVALQHAEGYRICQALIHPESGGLRIIPDFRRPDNIRIGITPLYTSFTEILMLTERLKEIVSNGEYKNYSEKKEKVT